MSKQRVVKTCTSYGKYVAAVIKDQPWWMKEVVKNVGKATLSGTKRFAVLHMGLYKKVIRRIEVPYNVFADEMEEIWGISMDRYPANEACGICERAIDVLAD